MYQVRRNPAALVFVLCLLAVVLLGSGPAVQPVAADPAPTRPTNVRVTWTSGGGVGLAWTPAVDDAGVVGYKVFRNGQEVGRNNTTNTANFLTLGDMSHCGTQYQAGLNQMKNVLAANPGRILISGDAVQFNGTASEFGCFNNVFGSLKGRMWPVPGNHEYNTANATPFFNYFGNLAGQPGKGWYSRRWGSWRIIGINSSCWEVGGCAPGDPQYNWLKAELEASTSACTAIVSHHPRWSTRNDGNATYLAPMYNLAFDHGVELWLSGDDHFYERYPALGPQGETHSTGITQMIVGTGGFETRGYGPYVNQGPDALVRQNETFGAAAFQAKSRSWTMTYKDVAGSAFNDQVSEPCHGPNSSVVKFRDRGLATGSTHTYRVQAYDAGGKVSALSSPVSVTIGSNQSAGLPPTNNSALPIGEFERANMSNGKVTVTGWALDPDTNGPINVEVWVDGVRRKVAPALTTRTDIGVRYGQGNNHGFFVQVPVTNKIHNICLWALNDNGNTNKRLGCKKTSARPEGRLQTATGANGRVTVSGWAIDPDTLGQIKIHLFIDGQRVQAFDAATNSNFVQRSYPAYSKNHGFYRGVSVSPGPHTVCVWAINNTNDGAHRKLGCRSVTA